MDTIVFQCMGKKIIKTLKIIQIIIIIIYFFKYIFIFYSRKKVQVWMKVNQFWQIIAYKIKPCIHINK